MSATTKEEFLLMLRKWGPSDCTMIVTTKNPEYTSENDTMTMSDDNSSQDDGSLVNANECDDADQEYKLHRKVLRNLSPVFNAMFEHKETTESKTGKINVKNVKPHIMYQALRAIYNVEFEGNLSVEDIQELMIVADRYDIQCLYEACEEYLIKSILNLESCITFLDNISQFQVLPKFINHCFMVFDENAEELLKHERLLEISEDTLLIILDLENMNISSELSLINFAVNWATRHNNIESNLAKETSAIWGDVRRRFDGKILSKLRMFSLTRDELLSPVLNFLSSDERTALEKAVENCGGTEMTHEIIEGYESVTSCFSRIYRKRSFDLKKKLDGKGLGLNVYASPFIEDDSLFSKKIFDFEMFSNNEPIAPSCTEFGFEALVDVNSIIGCKLFRLQGYIKPDFEATVGIYQEDGKIIEEIKNQFNVNNKLQLWFENHIHLKKDMKYVLKINFANSFSGTLRFQSDFSSKVNDCIMINYKKGQLVSVSEIFFAHKIL